MRTQILMILAFLALLGAAGGPGAGRAVAQSCWWEHYGESEYITICEGGAALPVAAGAALRALGMAAGTMRPGLRPGGGGGPPGVGLGRGGLPLRQGRDGLRLSAGGAAEAVGGTVRAAKGIIGMAVLAAETGGIGAAAAPAAGAAGTAAVAGGSRLAGARGLSMIAEGLRQEALGRTLGLPGLAAQGAWQRELGRAWMQAEQAADRRPILDIRWRLFYAPVKPDR
ncbi:MAG: hypothetical protein RMM07_11930 [Anaerolineae bacterium]|nr:hypothetical protein [Anaerolineae bacterium]